MSQQPNMDEILIDYLDGTLDAKRRKAVEILLKHDAKLRKTLAAMQQVRGVLRDLPIQAMPAAAATSLQEQLRPTVQASIPLYSRQWLICLAAAFAIAITAGLIIWSALPSPMDQRTVAMKSASPAAMSGQALARKQDSGLTAHADAKDMEPTFAIKVRGGAEQLRSGEPLSENEPTLMVVVADDIGGTEREIRNLLASNNIECDSVNPGAAGRDELTKEFEAEAAGKVATDAAPDVTPLAAGASRAMASKAQGEPTASAVPAPSILTAPSAFAAPAPPKALAPSAMAAGAAGAGPARGPQREAVQSATRAKSTGQQFGGAAQRRSQAPARQMPSEPYGVVVARNVTVDQLGKIRSGLHEASRAGNMRVVDPSADRISHTLTDNKQALKRDEQTNVNQQQVQTQSPWQYSNSQTLPNTQELASQNQNRPQLPISYSPRYDVTIVVQGKAAAAAANIPTWPAPTTTPATTLPAAIPAVQQQ